MGRLAKSFVLLLLALALTTAGAHGESLKSLQQRMDEVQARLDKATARVESLRDQAGRIDVRLRHSRARREQVESRHEGAFILPADGEAGLDDSREHQDRLGLPLDPLRHM